MLISEIFQWYVFFILGVAVVSYLYKRMRDRALSWELSRPRLLRCSTCNRVFLVKRHARSVRCPRCHGVSLSYITNH